jgi:hypothetical protein
LGKNRPAPTADASHRLPLGTLEALGEDGIAEKGTRSLNEGCGTAISGRWQAASGAAVSLVGSPVSSLRECARSRHRVRNPRA